MRSELPGKRMSGKGLYALTVFQPYANAIIYGGKRVENRGWVPPGWVIGQTIAIHAGVKIYRDAPPRAWDEAGLVPFPFPGQRVPDKVWSPQIPTRVILGIAVIGGYHHAGECAGVATVDQPRERGQFWCTPWSMASQFHWVLDSVQPLQQPVPCTGKQRLWPVPAEAAAAIRKQL